MKKEFKHDPRHYILTRTLRRKNARRRMEGRFYTKQACIDHIEKHYNPNCIYDIYSYDWKLLERVDIYKYLRKEKSIEAEHG